MKALILVIALLMYDKLSLACVPAGTIRHIAHHRFDHFKSEGKISNPVRVDQTSIDRLMNKTMDANMKRGGFRQLDMEESAAEKSKNEPDIKATEKPEISDETATDLPIPETTTFKLGTIDDP